MAWSCEESKGIAKCVAMLPFEREVVLLRAMGKRPQRHSGNLCGCLSHHRPGVLEGQGDWWCWEFGSREVFGSWGQRLCG